VGEPHSSERRKKKFPTQTLDGIADYVEDHTEENPAPANIGKLMEKLHDVEIVENSVKTDYGQSIAQETEDSRLPRIPGLNDVAQRHDSMKSDSGAVAKARSRDTIGTGGIASSCGRIRNKSNRDFISSLGGCGSRSLNAPETRYSLRHRTRSGNPGGTRKAMVAPPAIGRIGV
jgi:hypothetical protein